MISLGNGFTASAVSDPADVHEIEIFPVSAGCCGGVESDAEAVDIQSSESGVRIVRGDSVVRVRIRKDIRWIDDEEFLYLRGGKPVPDRPALTLAPRPVATVEAVEVLGRFTPVALSSSVTRVSIR